MAMAMHGHEAKMVQEGFEDLTNEPPNSPDLKHLWCVLHKQVPKHGGPTVQLAELKGSAANSFGSNSTTL